MCQLMFNICLKKCLIIVLISMYYRSQLYDFSYGPFNLIWVFFFQNGFYILNIRVEYDKLISLYYTVHNFLAHKVIKKGGKSVIMWLILINRIILSWKKATGMILEVNTYSERA
jgi:hypothetical protein